MYIEDIFGGIIWRSKSASNRKLLGFSCYSTWVGHKLSVMCSVLSGCIPVKYLSKYIIYDLLIEHFCLKPNCHQLVTFRALFLPILVNIAAAHLDTGLDTFLLKLF